MRMWKTLVAASVLALASGSAAMAARTDLVLGVVLDRRDPSPSPVLELHEVGRACEGESFLQVVEALAVRGDRIKQIAHRSVVGTVAYKHEMVEACRVVDEIWHHAPTQIDFAEILIRKDVFRCSVGAPIECPVDVKNSREIGLPRWPGDRAERVRLNRRARSPRGYLEQKIEIRRHDGSGGPAIRQDHERLVDRGRVHGARA